MPFRERFGLLVQSGQVSAAAAEAAQQVLTGAAAYLGRPLDEESGGMIATHLALAMERLARGEALAEAPPLAVTEARSYAPEWNAASSLLEKAAARWGRTAPAAEIAYLTIHLRLLSGGSA